MARIKTAIESALAEAAHVTYEELRGAQNMRDHLTGARKLREAHIEANPKEVDPLLGCQFVLKFAEAFTDGIQQVSDRETANLMTRVMLAEAIRFGIRMSEKFHNAAVVDLSTGKVFERDK